MVRPIRTLQAGAQRIAAGDLAQRIDVRTRDEVEALAADFNRMSARLDESYRTLEGKVEDRTAELRETLAQQTAGAEILRVISRSPGDLQPVFDTILEKAAALCDADLGMVHLYRDGKQKTVAHRGGSEAFARWLFARGEFVPPQGSANAAAMETGTPTHIEDYTQTEVYRSGDPLVEPLVSLGGIRTYLNVPMVIEGRVAGAIAIYRCEVRPFTRKQVELVSTFADQAVIAIENVRLFGEIQEKSRQLEIANKHKSEFLANMSHELRTPLNAVIGFSEVLQDDMFGDLNDEQKEFVKDIHDSGKHLLSLINDILDLSKVEAGRMELMLGEFDLPSAIGNAMTLVRERAGRHRVALSCDIDPSLRQVRADERKLKQILLNLLSNAVKFTPEGGQVKVIARARDAGVQVAVADTGVGIAPGDRETVFEEFRQVGTDYTRKAEGTGLGLPLARKFAELHGGTITLHSEPGRGSTFTVFLPGIRVTETENGR